MIHRRSFVNGAFVTMIGTKGHASTRAATKAPRQRPVIGHLTDGLATSDSQAWFTEALKAFGHGDFAIETRQSESLSWRLPALAAELVKLPVDVIWTTGLLAAQAAQQATRNIPIVMVGLDAVGAGIVTNLARPGGNVTGVNLLIAEPVRKRLELIKELVPRASNVVALVPVDPDPVTTPVVKSWWDEVQRAAAALHLPAQYASLNVRLYPFDDQYVRFASRPGTVLVAMESPYFLKMADVLAVLALKHRLPAVYPYIEHVRAGGLCSYGVSLKYVTLRVAFYVARILRGAKAGDLPFETPDTYELSINMKSARALGLTLSPRLQQRADELVSKAAGHPLVDAA